MFTGIVEEAGVITAIEQSDGGARLRIDAARAAASARVGDSIAVNGVCLTATDIGDVTFAVDVVPETLRRSSLGHVRVGDIVNVERPMRADGRFDGHIVQGHVDATGIVAAVTRGQDGGVELAIEAGGGLLRYIVEKGSITVDGVSLTVAGVDASGFRVALIPHTLEVTNLGRLESGALVNLEVDVIAKYVERLLEAHRS